MKLYGPNIPESLQKWALSQPLFFTASAPLRGSHVNVSPKGLTSTSLSILSPSHVAYLDATGSGCETAAHCYEPGNARVSIMFCSFDSLPRILRFFCKGEIIEFDDERFEPMLQRMGVESRAGARAIVSLRVFQVQTSCGMSVPMLTGSGPCDRDEEQRGNAEGTAEEDKALEEAGTLYNEGQFRDRLSLNKFAIGLEKKNKFRPYLAKNNASSMDGLPGLRVARKDAGQRIMMEDVRQLGLRFWSEKYGIVLGFLLALIVICVGQKSGVLKC